jgi:hypothetical protein
MLSPLIAEFFAERPAAALAAEAELRARLRREGEALALRRVMPSWEAAAWRESPRDERGADAGWREIAEAAETIGGHRKP